MADSSDDEAGMLDFFAKAKNTSTTATVTGDPPSSTGQIQSSSNPTPIQVQFSNAVPSQVPRIQDPTFSLGSPEISQLPVSVAQAPLVNGGEVVLSRGVANSQNLNPNANHDVQVVAEMRNQLAPKNVRTIYICTVDIKVGIPLTTSNPNGRVTTPLEICPYKAYVFNYGTVFRSTNSNIAATHFDRLMAGQDIVMEFRHTDLTRKSFDCVVFDVNNNKIKLQKPGNVTSVLQLFFDGKSFFLPETAVENVYKFFELTYQSDLICDSKLTAGATMSQLQKMQTTIGKDLGLLVKLCQGIKPAPISNPEDLNRPLINIPASQNLSNGILSPQGLRPSQKGDEEEDIQVVNEVAPMTRNESLGRIQIPGSQQSASNQYESQVLMDENIYTPLSQDQTEFVTHCQTCNTRFQYVVHRILHYTFHANCRQVMLAPKAGSPPKNSMYDYLGSYFDEHCKVSTGLVCTSCKKLCENVLQYCLHRDSHRDPKCFEVCIKCTGIYGSPFVFSQHECMPNILKPKSLNFKPRHDVRQTLKEDHYTIYLSLTKIVQDKLRTCLKCTKKFPFITAMQSHLTTSGTCYKHFFDNASKPNNIMSDGRLSFGRVLLTQNGIEAFETTCDVCGEVFANQVAYMLHQDHHNLTPMPGAAPKPVSISCKVCQGEFNSPCQFYSHSCLRKSSAWCLHCTRYNSPNFAITTNISESTTVVGKNEEESDGGLLAITSVQSLAAGPSETKPEVSNVLNETGTSGSAVGSVPGDDMDISIKDEPLSAHEASNVSNIMDSHSAEPEVDDSPPFDADDWYVCTSCKPCKLLRYSDGSLEKHSAAIGHYQINPLTLYNDFSIRIEDLTNNKEFKGIITELLKERKKQ